MLKFKKNTRMLFLFALCFLFAFQAEARNLAPTAVADCWPQGGNPGDQMYVGEPVIHSSGYSSDSDGFLEGWDWVLGDGTIPLPGVQNAIHTYTTAGDYTATLTVTDDRGATDTATCAISLIERDPCEAVNGSVEVSEGGACPSIQSAIDLTDGSPVTINVLAGTYTESLTITTSNISLVGAGNESTIIISPDLNASVISVSAVSDVTITGFSLGAGTDKEVVLITDSTAVMVDNNSFLDFSSKAINATNSAVVITNNKINGLNNIESMCDWGGSGLGGIDVNNEFSTIPLPVTISGNKIFNLATGTIGGNMAIAFHGNPESTGVNKAVISDNQTFSTDGGAIIILGSGEVHVRNNVIAHDYEQGIYIWQDDNSVAVVTGNTVTGAGVSYGGAYLVAKTGSTVTFSDNVIVGSYQNGVTVQGVGVGGTMEILNNVIFNSAQSGLDLGTNYGTLTISGNAITESSNGGIQFVDFKADLVSATVSSNIYGTISGEVNLIGDSTSVCAPPI